MQSGIRTPPKPRGYKSDWIAYGVLATSKQQRPAVLEKYGNICGVCNEYSPHVDAEHNFPLWLVDREDYPHCLKYWSISNLTATCKKCHRTKTSRETAARAKIKRIQKKTCKTIPSKSSRAAKGNSIKRSAFRKIKKSRATVLKRLLTQSALHYGKKPILPLIHAAGYTPANTADNAH